MEGLNISSLLTWLASMIGAITAITGAVLGFNKKARERFKNLVRRNTDADDMKNDIESLKTSVSELIELQKKTDGCQQLALQAMLRHEITDMYYKHLEDKKLAAYEKEDLIKMSEAYEKNHGNSYVQEIVNEMRHWDLAM